MPSQSLRKRGEKLLRPVHPNAGIEADYRRKLDALIAEMAGSVQYWIESAYRNNEPQIAQDETPADAMRRAMKKLSTRWLKRFDKISLKLADYFAKSVEKRSSASLRKALKDGGFTVEFKMTPAMRDIVDATVHANVALINSIPEQYLAQVEGIVMRSVQTGRDLGQVTKDLQEQFGVTRRRAALIARTQNNMATSAMSRARQLEVGLEEAVWVHSGGGHEPRPTHLAAGRERVRYKIAEGWLDPAIGEHIQPGSLPNCRCIGRPVVKGFS